MKMKENYIPSVIRSMYEIKILKMYEMLTTWIFSEMFEMFGRGVTIIFLISKIRLFELVFRKFCRSEWSIHSYFRQKCLLFKYFSLHLLFEHCLWPLSCFFFLELTTSNYVNSIFIIVSAFVLVSTILLHSKFAWLTHTKIDQQNNVTLLFENDLSSKCAKFSLFHFGRIVVILCIKWSKNL